MPKDQINNLGLPIHPDMLDVADKKTADAINYPPDGSVAVVCTAYTVMKYGREEETGNVSPILYTRPAANIIFLKRDRNGEIVLGLVQRERPAVGSAPARMVTKACGGYFHDGSTGDLQVFVDMIHQYVGLKVRIEDLYLCGDGVSGYISDPGHGAIRTPIAFTYTTKWEEDPSVTPKMELIWVSMSQAKEWCFNTLNNLLGINIEDTSSNLAILNVEHLLETGEIIIPTVCD